MKINNDFIIQQIIMPDMKPAYKIIFIDSQNLDNNQYFNGLSYEERSLLRPYFMEILFIFGGAGGIRTHVAF